MTKFEEKVRIRLTEEALDYVAHQGRTLIYYGILINSNKNRKLMFS